MRWARCPEDRITGTICGSHTYICSVWSYDNSNVKTQSVYVTLDFGFQSGHLPTLSPGVPCFCYIAGSLAIYDTSQPFPCTLAGQVSNVVPSVYRCCSSRPCRHPPQDFAAQCALQAPQPPQERPASVQLPQQLLLPHEQILPRHQSHRCVSQCQLDTPLLLVESCTTKTSQII